MKHASQTAIMRLMILVVFLFLTACLRAQDKCQFGSSEAGDALERSLNEQKSCKAAAQLMDQCWWGSSADAGFSSILVEKCEKEFFSKLSSLATENYVTEMQLCAYEYARQQGTISISEAARCQADIAERYAADPHAGDHAPPKASFDCAKAQTLLEKAVCSDIRLGHADVVLAEVYKRAQRSATQDVRPKFLQSERSWLNSLPSKCRFTSVPLTEKQINCLRDQMEIRFSIMDSCGEGGQEDTDNCLLTIDDPSNLEYIEPDPGMARASFDCETPKTALEIAICADSELGQADIELSNLYRSADARMDHSQHPELVKSERNWLRFVSSNCPLGAVGGIPPIMARACVRSAFEVRIAQLRECPQKPAPDQIHCLNDFQIIAK